jgi:multiple antibiotic resistance protein
MNDVRSVMSAALLLFLVMDPLGNIPAFLVTLKDVPPRRRTMVLLREMLIALAVLLIFLFAGQYILDLLGVSQPSLGIAGGTILFLIALRMIFASATETLVPSSPDGEPFIVPLAIPLIAGPSAMATLILLMARNPARWPLWATALGVAWAASSVILVSSAQFSRLLGQRGLLALERLMGMVLTAVAIEMFVDGIRSAFLQ